MYERVATPAGQVCGGPVTGAHPGGPRPAPPPAGASGGRFGRPRLPEPHLPRPRLVRALDAALRRPVTLLSAAAGSGKTALLAEWAATGRAPGPVAWLNLDRDGGTAARFWSDVAAALRRAGVADVPAPAGPAAGDAAQVRRIIAATERLSPPVALVLDNVDAAADPGVLAAVGVLLRCVPDGLRLVLAARADPALPLHRLRADGLLDEITADALAFTDEEAADLLALHGVPAGPRELRALAGRTEGWAVGLTLAARHLRGPGRRDIESFAGDRAAVAAYLTGEVLAGQPPAVRRFLLYTSIAGRVSGELADAVVGGGAGQAVLEQLQRANALVTAVPGHPGWYRYHPLLRDLLRHRLAVEEAAALPRLHRRAAAWFARGADHRAALAHAAAAGDWPFVGRLVVATPALSLLLTADGSAADGGPGDGPAPAAVLARIPAAQLPATPELMVCGALRAFHAGDPDAVAPWLADARRLVAARAPAERAAVEMAVRGLEVELARRRGDMRALGSAATDLLGRLADTGPRRLPSTAQHRAITLHNRGISLLWSDDLGRADRYLWSAAMTARSADLDLLEVDAVGHLAVVGYAQGAPGESRYQADAADDLADRHGPAAARHAVPGHLAVALTAVEQHRLAEADSALQRGAQAHRDAPEPTLRTALRVARIRLLLARQEWAAARTAIARTRHEAAGTPLPRLLERWLTQVEAELLLGTGEPGRAAAVLVAAGRRGLGQRERVCLARAAAALGQTSRAEGLLAPVLAAATDMVATVEAWVVSAQLAQRRRRVGAAVRAIANGVELALSDGLRRPFLNLDRRDALAVLEPYLLRRADGHDFAAELVAALAATRPAAGGTAPAGTELSERERDVVRHLPTMFTVAEIAEELHVSVNTVKAHLRSIYRKLDVSRRRDAVERARALSILP
ncbi:LuxR family transcriptional regulator [Pilimelia terevasa]|uniref:LuxR family transcriptional regulator n=1 Tax=Pilimelia terevasa TaxID=53372 RepID=A0A8J3BQA7_9ACTN|nr:LuxR C-terminal-related transcriptional regulator [Pilimelia terevasa]GGK41990.1 LuxR family transcriptional regulator [Pilimelia terevasa]